MEAITFSPAQIHVFNLVSHIKSAIGLEQIAELRQLVQMVGRTIQNQQIEPNDENQALFDIVVDYTYALDTLDDYDYQRLRVAETTQEDKFHATYDNAMEAIRALRDKFGGSSLFGNEKDDSFKSSIGQIYQTFKKAIFMFNILNTK